MIKFIIRLLHLINERFSYRLMYTMTNKFKGPYAVKVVDYEKKDGETAVYRNFIHGDKLISNPPNVFTLWQMYLTGYHASIGQPFLGTRRIENGVAKEYKWETHLEVRRHVENFGKGVRKLGLTRQKPIGVYGVNRREWTITELASYREAFIVVALYDTLGLEAIEHIINETEMEFIVATKDKIHPLILLHDKIPTIKYIISMDEDIKASDIENAKKVGVVILEFKQVELLGQTVTKESIMPAGHDIATICYTSGTTGLPKGVVITQAAGVASTYAAVNACEAGTLTNIDKNDVYISYLPLAHVFERVAQGIVIYTGGAIGYYQGNANKLMDDIVELKPTVFMSVPRVFNRIYDKVLAGINAKGGLAKKLFYTAYNTKKANLDFTVTHWLYDCLVFKKVRNILGGKVRFLLTGSAPIDSEVLNFMKICFSVDMHQGYGQTENYCGGVLTIVGNNTSNVVGAPFACSEFKLIDVPDMKYLSTDSPYPRGEICIRGNSVMKGYYKDPKKTAETIDSEGWLHTGDIGMLDDANRLTVIDRLKNIFKLSQGEYIAPEKIEGVYQKHELIGQIFVYGDSKQSQLVSIIVLDKEIIAKQPKYLHMSFEEACHSDRVKAALLKEFNDFAKDNGLKGFEQIRALYFTTKEFTIENNLLTPTFKLKREAARTLYFNQIIDMYNKLTDGRSFS